MSKLDALMVRPREELAREVIKQQKALGVAQKAAQAPMAGVGGTILNKSVMGLTAGILSGTSARFGGEDGVTLKGVSLELVSTLALYGLSAGASALKFEGVAKLLDAAGDGATCAYSVAKAREIGLKSRRKALEAKQRQAPALAPSSSAGTSVPAPEITPAVPVTA